MEVKSKVKALFKFFREVYFRVNKNDLIAMANALTFKLTIAIFPFLIFLMTIVANCKIEYSEYIEYVLSGLPNDVHSVITVFLEEAVYTRHTGLMSLSLLIALFSASSGFYSFIKGLNRAYGIKEKRNYFYTRGISLFLVLMFSLTILLSIYMLILGNQINEILVSVNILKTAPQINGLLINIMTALVVTVVIILVYRIGADINIKTISILPGTLFTLGIWFILSKLFNIYVNKYASYSAVYGSIGTMFVFLLWLNLLSYVLLIGCQINAVLCDEEFMKGLY